jgi:K+-transporting ATPase KdpF subunit
LGWAVSRFASRSSKPVTGSEETIMAWLAVAVSALTFVYLFVALIRPEWF